MAISNHHHILVACLYFFEKSYFSVLFFAAFVLEPIIWFLRSFWTIVQNPPLAGLCCNCSSDIIIYSTCSDCLYTSRRNIPKVARHDTWSENPRGPFLKLFLFLAIIALIVWKNSDRLFRFNLYSWLRFFKTTDAWIVGGGGDLFLLFFLCRCVLPLALHKRPIDPIQLHCLFTRNAGFGQLTHYTYGKKIAQIYISAGHVTSRHVTPRWLVGWLAPRRSMKQVFSKVWPNSLAQGRKGFVDGFVIGWLIDWLIVGIYLGSNGLFFTIFSQLQMSHHAIQSTYKHPRHRSLTGKATVPPPAPRTTRPRPPPPTALSISIY